ncbi:MAG: response regulator [Desulfobacteraceae bacterium]|nr:MAG: response regulator [Desulfobacteraceae bacterium]
MPVITVFSGDYCDEADVVWRVRAKTGYELVTDHDLMAEAGKRSGIAEETLERLFSARQSIFDRLGRERERSLAYLKLSVAEMLAKEKLIFAGFSGQLIPKTVTHVLRVCLIADLKYRLAAARKIDGLSEKEAVKQIGRLEEDRASWMRSLFGKEDPWEESFYDIVLPMDKIGIQQAVNIIWENAKKSVVEPTGPSRQAVKDFLLEARVQEALIKAGHFVGIAVSNGAVTLTINKHVLRLKRLEDELRSIAETIPGIASVTTKVGKDYHKSNVYRQHDFSLPDRVLIVDDEREFGHSLSERLVMCDIGAAVTDSGETALDLIREEEPEVMIIDLRMPGIDGLEILRRVKKTTPEVEVVILTAQGSEAERKLAMELGAFAFLQKPVDIDLLSETLRQAKEKMRRNMQGKPKP